LDFLHVIHLTTFSGPKTGCKGHLELVAERVLKLRRRLRLISYRKAGEERVASALGREGKKLALKKGFDSKQRLGTQREKLTRIEKGCLEDKASQEQALIIWEGKKLG